MQATRRKKWSLNDFVVFIEYATTGGEYWMTDCGKALGRSIGSINTSDTIAKRYRVSYEELKAALDSGMEPTVGFENFVRQVREAKREKASTPQSEIKFLHGQETSLAELSATLGAMAQEISAIRDANPRPATDLAPDVQATLQQVSEDLGAISDETNESVEILRDLSGLLKSRKMSSPEANELLAVINGMMETVTVIHADVQRVIKERVQQQNESRAHYLAMRSWQDEMDKRMDALMTGFGLRYPATKANIVLTNAPR